MEKEYFSLSLNKYFVFLNILYKEKLILFLILLFFIFFLFAFLKNLNEDIDLTSAELNARLDDIKETALSTFNKDTKGEFKFPFKVKITFQEKTFGKNIETLTQTSCREVSNYLDIMTTADGLGLIPDYIINDATKIFNKTIDCSVLL